MNRIKFGAPFIAGIIAFGVYSSTWAHDGHDEGKTSGAVATITEEDIEYSPEEQTVHAGQLIRVENKDPFDHKSRVTRQLPSGGLGEIVSFALMIPSALTGKDIGNMKRTMASDYLEKPGSSFTFRLDKPGTYEIRCLLHDGMVATLHVTR